MNLPSSGWHLTFNTGGKKKKMNTELLEALSVLEKEKNISKDTILDAIEQSLLQACKNHFGKADNVTVTINRETGDFHVMAAKTVAEEVEDSVEQISLADAKMIDPSYEPGDKKKKGIRKKTCGRTGTEKDEIVFPQ